MSAQAPNHPADYRPDVDGLRAVAVLAVIVFHASASLLPGGFAGVDVFFVISGFLISGLIIRAMEQERFSFTEFYTRRIKRILPAYIVVALATLAVASVLLIPNDYIFYTTSLAASWAFASNIFFSLLSWGYFGQRTEEFPLLHTWSLSVEEQFYFAFPILLLFLFRYLRAWIVPALCVIGLAFLALSEAKTGSVKSYFLLTSRAHELILGALTFYLARRHPPRPAWLATLIAVAGAAMMLASMFILNSGSAFPGINSLYPCVGAAMLIYAGASAHALRPFLASRPMVGIGLISYSLYLWHWPIFSFMRYRRIEIDLLNGTLAVALAFVLAVLTWKFVEMPVRNMRKLTFRTAALRYYALPCAFFMAIGAYSFFTEGAPLRFPDETRQLISSYSFERDLARTCSIRPDDYQKVTLEHLDRHCAFGATGQRDAAALLIGDSHANHFKPFLEQLSADANVKSYFHVQGGCFPIYLPGDGPRPEQAGDLETCGKRNADLLQQAGRFRYVVLAGFWSSEFDSNFAKRLDTVVSKIEQAGATPVVFKDNPSYKDDKSRCILYRKRGWVPADTNCNIPYQAVAQSEGPVDAVIDEVARRHPKLVVVDPKRVMCDGKECVTYIGNTALYKDWNHINAKAAKMLAERYIAAAGNPLAGGAGAAPKAAAVPASVSPLR